MFRSLAHVVTQSNRSWPTKASPSSPSLSCKRNRTTRRRRTSSRWPFLPRTDSAGARSKKRLFFPLPLLARSLSWRTEEGNAAGRPIGALLVLAFSFLALTGEQGEEECERVFRGLLPLRSGPPPLERGAREKASQIYCSPLPLKEGEEEEGASSPVSSGNLTSSGGESSNKGTKWPRRR